jgi:hypothetical protein
MSWLEKLLSSFKIGGGKGGGLGGLGDLGSLLPLLLMAGGGAYGFKQTKNSTKELQDAANKSNEYAEKTLGGARNDFKPYMEGGTKALGMVFDQLNQPGIASKYLTPIKRPESSNLRGTISLKQLMGK